MSVPSRMSVRQFPKALEPRIRIAYSAAWEGVITTHSAQALEFMQEFASRLPVLDALSLYFRVVAVPEPMQEPVRTRALVELDLDSLAPRHQFPPLSGLGVLRPDLVLRAIRTSAITWRPPSNWRGRLALAPRRPLPPPTSATRSASRGCWTGGRPWSGR